jgi:hypothetical protein
MSARLPLIVVGMAALMRALTARFNRALPAVSRLGHGQQGTWGRFKRQAPAREEAR